MLKSDFGESGRLGWDRRGSGGRRKRDATGYREWQAMETRSAILAARRASAFCTGARLALGCHFWSS